MSQQYTCGYVQTSEELNSITINLVTQQFALSSNTVGNELDDALKRSFYNIQCKALGVRAEGDLEIKYRYAIGDRYPYRNGAPQNGDGYAYGDWGYFGVGFNYKTDLDTLSIGAQFSIPQYYLSFTQF